MSQVVPRVGELFRFRLHYCSIFPTPYGHVDPNHLDLIPLILTRFHFHWSLISCNPTDARVEEWPMVKSPLPTLGLCLSYVVFVKVIGPRLMKNREPFNIRWLMITYNLVMVAVSTYIFWMLGVYGWFGKYNYLCQPVDYSNSEDAIGVSIINPHQCTFAHYHFSMD